MPKGIPGKVLAACVHNTRSNKAKGLCKYCYEQARRKEPNYCRYRNLLTLYKLTRDEFAALEKEQKGLCAICEQLPTGDLYLSVDHDHITGKVRGLLCKRCNSGIAFLNEDISILGKAIHYLATRK